MERDREIYREREGDSGTLSELAWLVAHSLQPSTVPGGWKSVGGDGSRRFTP